MMPDSEKFKILIYNSTKGVEFTLSLSGDENFQKAKTFLQKIDPDSERQGGSLQQNKSTEFYVLSDEQLSELGALMKQTN
jgi:hypothetical protein